MAAKFPTRRLGDEQVSAIGLQDAWGCPSPYSTGGFDDEESLKVLTRAADLGLTFWDTSDIYGHGKNEELIGRWFKETGRRGEIFLASKFGNLRTPEEGHRPRRQGSGCVRRQEASLKRLGVDTIDLYYQHPSTPTVPVEEAIEAMVELKNEGKIRYWVYPSARLGRCVRGAHKVHPIAAAQMEFSPFALEIESEQTDFLEDCTRARRQDRRLLAAGPRIPLRHHQEPRGLGSD